MDSANTMKAIRINKVVVNIGTGSEEKHAEAAKRLLELMTGMKPAEEMSKRRAPAFKITKGQVIGAFVTLRGQKAGELLKRLFDAVDDRVKDSSITQNSPRPMRSFVFIMFIASENLSILSTVFLET